MILGLDFETYSAADISLGAQAYAAHESTGVHVVCGALASEVSEVERFTWVPGMPVPPRAVAHVRAGRPVLAHNAAFEAAILEHVLCPRYGWPHVRVSQWRDTAADAALFGLPVKLEGLAKALGSPVEKDTEGAKVMRRVSSTPELSAADREVLERYCMQDVLTMLACYWRLPEPSRDELQVQIADREINQRGIPIDLRYVDALNEMLRKRLKRLDAKAAELTDYELLTVAKSAGPLHKYLVARGVTTETLTRNDLDQMLGTADTCELPPDLRQLLGVRRESSRRASLTKLARLRDMVAADGRLRGVLRYCGAHTGRWASHGLQVHNLPRARKADGYNAEALRAAVLAGDHDAAVRASPDVLRGLSWQLRSVVAAPPGCELIGGDYSAIEARVVAWLAGQHDVVQMFADGVDVYTEDARRAGSTDRQFGKVQRLGFGYGMAALKAREAAEGYGVHLSGKEAFRAVRVWREHNGQIVALWQELERAAHAALLQPKTPLRVGAHLIVVYMGQALQIVLPSGRALHYWRPKSVPVTRRLRTATEDGRIVEREVSMVELRYWVEAPSRNGMVTEGTYGGKLTENVTQAVARDLLAAAVLRLRPTIYRVVLHVHDSITAEVPHGAGSTNEFGAILCESPAWAYDLPMAADCYRGPRFKG